MKQAIQLRPEMGAIVLNHLRQFGELPSKGILAGQAVDSAITDLFGKGGGVYNDVDIFRSCPSIAYTRELPRKVTNTAMRGTLTQSMKESYGSMAVVMEVIDSYGIASVTRKDKLNFVNCFKASGHMRTGLSASEVIAAFDLNCTRVAVDLATQQLVWDSHYEDFLASRQLRIAMVHTPWHTFLRMAKKLKELPGVYADLEEAAQVCTSVSRSSYIGNILRDRNVSLMFGEKHQQLANELSSDWQPYFAMEEKLFLQKGSKLTPSWVEKKDAVRANPGEKQVSLWTMNPRGDIDKQLQTRIDKMGAGCLFLAPRAVNQSRRANSSKAYVKLDAILKSREEASQGHRHGAMGDFVYACANTLGLDYVEGQALPAVADKVSNFVTKHRRMQDKLLGLSLAQQHETIQRIQRVTRAFAKSKGSEVDAQGLLGVLETEGNPLDFQSEKLMTEILAKAWARDNEPFKIEKLKLPKLPESMKDFEITELDSARLLKEEGSVMGHCVGGYTHAVANGQSRILRIRHKSDRKAWTTVELQPVKHRTRKSEPAPASEVTYSVRQHYAAGNKAPDSRNVAVLDYVVKALNLPPSLRSRLEKGTAGNWAKLRMRVLNAGISATTKLAERLQKSLEEASAKLAVLTKEAEKVQELAALAELKASPKPSALAGLFYPNEPDEHPADDALRVPAPGTEPQDQFEYEEDIPF